MREKSVPFIVTLALIAVASSSAIAQPLRVGTEIKVSQATGKALRPVVAFAPSGGSVVVWQNTKHGIMARTYDRNGVATSAETVLVANRNLPGIPAMGEVLVRREPAVVVLPNEEIVVFWTEERTFLNLDHFWERRELLDEDVLTQRFSSTLVPIGPRLRVNTTTAGFQRRPHAALQGNGIVVAFESSDNGKDSTAVYGRLLTRRGRPTGAELRIDDGRAEEVWNVAVAANRAGDFVVAWEIGDAVDTDILARFYDRTGAPLGSQLVANADTAGRQRRPAALATRDGDFLIAWQSYVKFSDVHGIVGQFYSSGGSRVGAELGLSKGSGEVQISPAMALLPSGRIVVAWMDWVEQVPLGVFAVVVDESGRRLADEIKISTERLYPQYQIAVAANAFGEVVGTWEGRQVSRAQTVIARHLKAD